ncbi:unnamed protein product [Calicophoron daubneyi]|uniref:Transposase n=1 Tax=Calicophoron daubneyi TaxID=300641 RepID=A0AAV2TSH9_CALDB
MRRLSSCRFLTKEEREMLRPYLLTDPPTTWVQRYILEAFHKNSSVKDVCNLRRDLVGIIPGHPRRCRRRGKPVVDASATNISSCTEDGGTIIRVERIPPD